MQLDRCWLTLPSSAPSFSRRNEIIRVPDMVHSLHSTGLLQEGAAGRCRAAGVQLQVTAASKWPHQGLAMVAGL